MSTKKTLVSTLLSTLLGLSLAAMPIAANADEAENENDKANIVAEEGQALDKPLDPTLSEVVEKTVPAETFTEVAPAKTFTEVAPAETAPEAVPTETEVVPQETVDETVEEETTEQPKDAHFFIRYDHSNTDEQGDTHYSPAQYFPVGDVADNYEYGSSKSDYTSVDGTVKTDTAYVSGAENVIKEAKVNIYTSFDVNENTVKEFFSVVYDDIVTMPSREVISKSILAALGETWQSYYDCGKVDVLWYVVKRETPYINVDGALYWVKTGDMADDEKPVDPAPDPEPEPEPPAPEPEPEPTPEPEPAPEPAPTPEVDPQPEAPEETIVDDAVPTAKADTAVPHTSDDSIAASTSLILAGALVLLSAAIATLVRKRK